MLQAAKRLGRWLGLFACGVLIAATARAQPFPERLEGLAAAVQRHLAANPELGASLENTRLAWLFLPGDREPDALVILRQGLDDCATTARRRPCTALLFKGLGRGQFQLATEFKQRLHPLALEIAGNELRALYVTPDTGNSPVYRRYTFDGQNFVPAAEAVATAQLMERRVVQLDDRSMAALADEQQAARGFPNAQARLAPFRLYVDTVAVNKLVQENPLITDASFDLRLRTLQEALLPDAERLVTALPWPQMLELRLWSCVDWMVPRRFWEVEDRRLARIGTCAEPAIFALKQGLVRTPEAMAALVRYRLLRDVGVAYLLRVASQPLILRQVLRQSQSESDTLFLGAVAGLLIGQQLRLQSLEQAVSSQAGLRQVSGRWFEKFERDDQRYLSKTPELRGFDAELDLGDTALACLRAIRNIPCPANRAEQAARVQQMIKESLQP